MLSRADLVDVIGGPQTYHRLPQLLDRADKGERVIDIEYAIEDKFDHLPKPEKARIRKAGVSAFLSVQEGCDKFCTFCVVPYTRGAGLALCRAYCSKHIVWWKAQLRRSRCLAKTSMHGMVKPFGRWRITGMGFG